MYIYIYMHTVYQSIINSIQQRVGRSCASCPKEASEHIVLVHEKSLHLSPHHTPLSIKLHAALLIWWP